VLTAGVHPGSVSIRVSVAGVNKSVTFSENVTVAHADLAITLSAPTSVTHGSTLQVSVAVTNDGPNLAPGVLTGLLLPSGWTVVSAPSATEFGPVLSWSDAALPAGASVSYTVTLKACSAKTSSVLVSGVSSLATDPDPGNNLAVAVIRST
jgi:uncharacterized repeat protein (TIGR01451 family)